MTETQTQTQEKVDRRKNRGPRGPHINTTGNIVKACVSIRNTYEFLIYMDLHAPATSNIGEDEDGFPIVIESEGVSETSKTQLRIGNPRGHNDLFFEGSNKECMDTLNTVRMTLRELARQGIIVPNDKNLATALENGATNAEIGM